MEIFNGIYSWDGKKHDGRDPVAWFPGAYNLRIFNLAVDSGGITHLDPTCVFFPKPAGGILFSKTG